MGGETQLQCVICFSLYNEAVETDCGHAFCELCLKEHMKKSNNCPTCRNEIRMVHPSYALRDIVNQYGSDIDKLMEDANELRAEDEDPLSWRPPGYQLGEKTYTIPFVVSGAICGGEFVAGDLYTRELLPKYKDFLSYEEFHKVITDANRTAQRWTPSGMMVCCCCLVGWPACGCCVLFAFSHQAIVRVRRYLKAQNTSFVQRGIKWELQCDGNDACEMDEHYSLLLHINEDVIASLRSSQNHSKQLQVMQSRLKTREDELNRLQAENLSLQRIITESGSRLARTVSGHFRAMSPRVVRNTLDSPGMRSRTSSRTSLTRNQSPLVPEQAPQALPGAILSPFQSGRGSAAGVAMQQMRRNHSGSVSSTIDTRDEATSPLGSARGMRLGTPMSMQGNAPMTPNSMRGDSMV
eukprot:GFYU01005699.1.p1 GENE.GFYU01005699.1~~GFYU01005699.1.p1  ORF type:complete len:409 (-),score=50.94 GFYU01005699.1:312-1538(-)